MLRLRLSARARAWGQDGRIGRGARRAARGWEGSRTAGTGALAVREVPDYLDPGQIAPALSEIAEAILTGGGADPDSARDAVLHTMACKAAVKGGQDNSPEELMVVAKAVVSGQVKYCPHGRPVAITLTKKELEKQFKRA